MGTLFVHPAPPYEYQLSIQPEAHSTLLLTFNVHYHLRRSFSPTSDATLIKNHPQLHMSHSSPLRNLGWAGTVAYHILKLDGLHHTALTFITAPLATLCLPTFNSPLILAHDSNPPHYAHVLSFHLLENLVCLQPPLPPPNPKLLLFPEDYGMLKLGHEKGVARVHAPAAVDYTSLVRPIANPPTLVKDPAADSETIHTNAHMIGAGSQVVRDDLLPTKTVVKHGPYITTEVSQGERNRTPAPTTTLATDTTGQKPCRRFAVTRPKDICKGYSFLHLYHIFLLEHMLHLFCTLVQSPAATTPPPPIPTSPVTFSASPWRPGLFNTDPRPSQVLESRISSFLPALSTSLTVLSCLSVIRIVVSTPHQEPCLS